MPTIQGVRVPDKFVDYDEVVTTLGSPDTVLAASDEGVTPLVLTVTDASIYTLGDLVKIASVGGTTIANGWRLVSKVTHVTGMSPIDEIEVTDINGNALTSDADWTAGGTITPVVDQTVVTLSDRDFWVSKIRVLNPTGGSLHLTISDRDGVAYPGYNTITYATLANTLLQFEPPEHFPNGAMIIGDGALQVIIEGWEQTYYFATPAAGFAQPE